QRKGRKMSNSEQQRQAAWRVRLIRHASETTKNVSKTCRHFGISRKTFYKFVARYGSHGEAGLFDRPTRPHRSPNPTPKEVVSKVLYLRQKSPPAGRCVARPQGSQFAGVKGPSSRHIAGYLTYDLPEPALFLLRVTPGV